jgi:hypothetical protein
MIRWELLPSEAARRVWDNALSRFDDYSPFQCYRWGEYRRGLGWEPFRWVAFNETGDIVAMLQATLRRHRFGFGLLWSEGGPVGDITAFDAALQSTIGRTVGLKRVYFRFRSDRSRDVEDVLRLNALGWKVSWASLSSNFSMALDLTQDEAAILAGHGRNWRQNLRRSGKTRVKAYRWDPPDAQEILKVYRSMQDLKGLDEQHSPEEIEQLLKQLGDQIVVARSDDEHGQLLSLAGALVAGTQANLWLSATTEVGRHRQAAYASCAEVLRLCRGMGVRNFDLGGIDPVSNPGVYRFKKGTGATHLELLGEWDWATSGWLRWFGNWAIAQRRHIRRAETAVKKATPAIPPENGAAVPAQVSFNEG